MNPIEISQVASLCASVAKLIKSELSNGTVQTVANQIVVSLSRFEVEHRLGNLLQQIYRTIDQHFPIRNEHLSLVIKDLDGTYENCFKIWRSV
ncbi:hypothetical protein [Mucilaginibacter sp. SG564]|uniref:hypothetical protein n=1 Tax=Mucilaginibacter sp. SG564 TaxID=2587022 RepID=UPI00155832A3|nr:hypothetical protein [Mucilaginibacter sp. SG564]NOW96064.1 hypothetical protein [Mucilaginibacter sp. SG564]